MSVHVRRRRGDLNSHIRSLRGVPAKVLGPDWRSRLADSIPSTAIKVVTFPFQRYVQTDPEFRFEQSRMLNHAFKFISHEDVVGDYLEFGVESGGAFVEAWRAAKRHGLSAMHFYAFDSFEGLPEINGVDTDGPFVKGQCYAGRKAFDARLASGRVPPERVTVVQGLFDVSLASAPRPPVAVAWIDCDLYESTIPVLNYLTGLIQTGTVLVFDDWFCFKGSPDRGEQRACREWLTANPHISLTPYRSYYWAGTSFIVTLKGTGTASDVYRRPSYEGPGDEGSRTPPPSYV